MGKSEFVASGNHGIFATDQYYPKSGNYDFRYKSVESGKTDRVVVDFGSYPQADSLQTAANRALVGSSFAFLFHEGIYSKEQVFEEIPQAKEYYLKYCKETDSATNIISDTTNTP